MKQLLCPSTSLTLSLLFLAAVIGCKDASTDGDKALTDSLTSVTLALNWYAEAEHGGYIAAKELGYFTDAGIDVKVQQGGPGAPNLVIQELASGRISFAISNADLVVLARAKNVNIVAVAAPLQLSPRCIMVHESSGIQTLEQLANVQLAISDSRPFALWMKKKLPLTNVTMVPYSGQVGEFILNKNFAQQGYVFSEPFLAKENNSDPKVLMLSDIGFNPYGSLLVTTQKTIDEQPDLVRNMVQASVKGWSEYLQNPEPINASINAENQDMSLEALAFGAAAMKPLCEPSDGERLCGMNEERWSTLIQQIEELEEIEPGSVTANACFNTSFLPAESKAPAE